MSKWKAFKKGLSRGKLREFLESIISENKIKRQTESFT